MWLVNIANGGNKREHCGWCFDHLSYIWSTHYPRWSDRDGRDRRGRWGNISFCWNHSKNPSEWWSTLPIRIIAKMFDLVKFLTLHPFQPGKKMLDRFFSMNLSMLDCLLALGLLFRKQLKFSTVVASCLLQGVSLTSKPRWMEMATARSQRYQTKFKL